MNTRRDFLRLAGMGAAALATGFLGLGQADKALALAADPAQAKRLAEMRQRFSQLKAEAR